MVDVAGGTTDLYLDGILVGTATITVRPPTTTLYLVFGGATLQTTFYLDALAVDKRRVGLLDDGPNHGAYTHDTDVEIDGVGFNLTVGATYQEKALSAFNPKLGTGAPKYSDLTGWQHFVWSSLHSGTGQAEFSDEFKYLVGENVDTTETGMVRLANKITDTPFLFTPPSSAYLADGFICSASNDDFSLFGLAFGNAAPSASHQCLFAYSADGAQAYSFTCTYGIQDILDNGSYTFVTPGGARIQKSSRAGGLTFSEGAGADSVIFDDGGSIDSVTFSAIFTWSDAGDSVIIPTDMGQMAIHDEFVWIAERDTPWVHRAAQLDLSDLQGGNPDDDATYDPDATRVGPGRVPITAMCSYQGSLYIGREDGLYRLWIDGEDIYTKLEDPVTRSRDNYRGMCVYNGFLMYQENGEVYQWNGANKQRVTPGPISDHYPYERVQRWAGFWPHGRYSIAVASSDPESDGKPKWYIWLFLQGAWCRIATLNSGYEARVNALPMPVVTLVNGVPQTRVLFISDTDGYPHMFSQDARHGATGVGGPVEQTGYILSSTTDFGLPQIWRAMSLLRTDIENLVPGTNRVKCTYYADNDTTEQTLGTFVDPTCDFVEFADKTTLRKFRLKCTLEADDASSTPIVRRVVIRYMDRPETVWGCQFPVDLVATPRTYSGGSAYYSVYELQNLLEGWRDEKTPLTFRDPLGVESEAYVTDATFTIVSGQGADRPATATITLMATDRLGLVLPATGLTYTVT